MYLKSEGGLYVNFKLHFFSIFDKLCLFLSGGDPGATTTSAPVKVRIFTGFNTRNNDQERSMTVKQKLQRDDIGEQS